MSYASPAVPAPPRPRTPAPELKVPLVGGGTWSLSEQSPAAFTMVVFYRGLHCPSCRNQLGQLDSRFGELTAMGVQPVAVSADSVERAEHVRTGWGVREVPVAYGLTVPTMREWGLFVSRGSNPQEPEFFNEPGLFLVKPDGELYYAAIANMPFGRPPLDELIGGMSFVLGSRYPARGDA
ncbi:redoxin domain-containing protein [Streptomyces thermolilacinus]